MCLKFYKVDIAVIWPMVHTKTKNVRVQCGVFLTIDVGYNAIRKAITI